MTRVSPTTFFISWMPLSAMTSEVVATTPPPSKGIEPFELPIFPPELLVTIRFPTDSHIFKLIRKLAKR